VDGDDVTRRLASAISAAHGTLAVVCLCAPGRTARTVRDRPGRALRVAVVLLGMRHLAEAPLAGRRSRRWALVAAGVDGLHATSMFALAALRPGLRRAGVVDGTVATTLAVAELAEAVGAGA
jgi:hypothetical protein